MYSTQVSPGNFLIASFSVSSSKCVYPLVSRPLAHLWRCAAKNLRLILLDKAFIPPCLVVGINFWLWSAVGWRSCRDGWRGGVHRFNRRFRLTRLAREHWRHAIDRLTIDNCGRKVGSCRQSFVTISTFNVTSLHKVLIERRTVATLVPNSLAMVLFPGQQYSRSP